MPQTTKEALLSALKGDAKSFRPDVLSAMRDIVYPGDRYFNMKKFEPYGTGPDDWGVLWTNRGPNPMFDGSMVAKDFRLFEDVADWKKHVKFPKFNKLMLKMIFGGMQKQMGINREEHVVSCMMLSGTFERVNQMVGFENALCAFYDCPDEMKKLLNAICEYKLRCIELAYECLKPDVIHMHDDWGTNSNMFFSPEIWREFIKPIEKRYTDKIHELGMIYMHHSCGYIQQIVPDLVEIGVDALNPMMTCNNIEELMELYGDNITFCGGIDALKVEQPGTTEEEIRQEIRKSMDRYVGKGRYIPYFLASTERAFKIAIDEIHAYGQKWCETDA